MSWLPLIFGAIGNMMVEVAALCRHPSTGFTLLLAADLMLFAARVLLIFIGQRAIKRGSKTPIDVFIVSSVMWAGLIGISTAMCMASGDPILQFLSPTTMMGIVGGLVTRNHVVPRLAIVQLMLCDVPLQTVLPYVGTAWVYISVIQCPMFILGLIDTVYRFNHYHLALLTAQRESEERATHDALTGLMNRSGLMERLARDLTAPLVKQQTLALLYLDLDGFKAVNDTYGHGAGDRLLQQVGERIGAILPERSLVARIGGDEFVILTPVADRTRAGCLATNAINEMAKPFEVEPTIFVTIGTSVGIAYAVSGATPEQFLAEADRALYRAKLAGKGRFTVAGPETHDPTGRQIAA